MGEPRAAGSGNVQVSPRKIVLYDAIQIRGSDLRPAYVEASTVETGTEEIEVGNPVVAGLVEVKLTGGLYTG